MALSAESPATWVDNLAVVVSLNTLTLFKFYPLSVRVITWFFSTWWVSNKKKNRNHWFYREDIEVVKGRKTIWAFRYHGVKSIVGINQNEILKKLKPEIFQIRYGCGYDCDSIIFISGLFLREKESSGTGWLNKFKNRYNIVKKVMYGMGKSLKGMKQ